MNNVAFENLLKYLKQLNKDKKIALLEDTLIEYSAWLSYSMLNFNKDYKKYFDVLYQCRAYSKDFIKLNDYLEDQIIYWNLCCNEEDY